MSLFPPRNQVLSVNAVLYIQTSCGGEDSTGEKSLLSLNLQLVCVYNNGLTGNKKAPRYEVVE